MVVTTFGVLMMVLFDDAYSDGEGLGPLSFIVMTLRILGGGLLQHLRRGCTSSRLG